MENKTVIIQGSSKSDGNTNTIVNYLVDKRDFDFIDLKPLNIGTFEYNYSNADDDFLPLAERIITSYDTLIFATPIYWYSMSATLKLFFDRVSDLLHYKKELGRKLRGKNMAIISCGSDAELKKGFNMPFIESANYLGMHYLGDVHTWIEQDTIPKLVKKDIDAFLEKINITSKAVKF